MSIKAEIAKDIIDAMRLKDLGKDRRRTLRLLQANIKQKEIDGQITLNDAQVYELISKMIKQRKEAIIQFTKGNRQDLVNKEQQEIDILKPYLPKPLSDKTLQRMIHEAVKKTNATSLKDMGKVMNLLKTAIQGRADMRSVSAKIKELLSE